MDYMSRWDDRNYDNYNYEGMVDEEEETRLLKKFQDYKELEKKEVEKRRFLEISNKTKPGVWTNRFIISSIIQVAAITALTISLVVVEMISSDVNLMELLSSSFNGPAKWFFFGYIMYMTLVVAIAVTAVFYNHLETNLKKEISGYRNFLVWINLIGVNVGGALATLLMIFVGLEGSGVTSLVSSQAVFNSKTEIMDQFIVPIGGFIVLLTIGALSGGIAYLATYLQKKS